MLHESIPVPQKGKQILDWAIPVAQRLNALEGKQGAAFRNERDRRGASAPHPFEVRFDGSLDDGEGGWKIYLPGADLVCVNGAYTGIPDGASLIEGSWYELDDIGLDASAVYLDIEAAFDRSGTGETSVSASAAFSDGASGDGGSGTPGEAGNAISRSLLVARLSYRAGADSAPATAEVKQCIVGAVALDLAKSDPDVDDVSVELWEDATAASEGGEESAPAKLAVKGWHDQAAERGTLSGMLATAAGSSPPEGEVVVRVSGENGPALKYVPIGSGLAEAVSQDIGLDIVTNVEYGEFEGYYRIRITKRHASFGDNGALTLGNPVYSYIETEPHSSEMDAASGEE